MQKLWNVLIAVISLLTISLGFQTILTGVQHSKFQPGKHKTMIVKDIPSEHLLYKEKLKELVPFGLEIRRAFQGVHMYISPVYINT